MFSTFFDTISSDDFILSFDNRQLSFYENQLQSPLVSWDELNNLLAQETLSFPQLKVVHHDDELMKGYAGMMKYSIGELGDIRPKIRKNFLFTLLKNGGTLVIERCHNFFPLVNQMVLLLEKIFKCTITANLYGSWAKNTTGFGKHFDDHDVISIQCYGEKRWACYPPTIFDPLPNQKSFYFPRPTGEPDKILVNKPNSFIFIPRGFWHDVTSITTPNLHVSFGIIRPRNLDLVRALIDSLAVREDFRSPLSLKYNEESLKLIIENTIQVLNSADPSFWFNKVNSTYKDDPKEVFKFPFLT